MSSGHGFRETGGARQSTMTLAFLPASPAMDYTALAYQAIHSRSHTQEGRRRSLLISAGANAKKWLLSEMDRNWYTAIGVTMPWCGG